MSQIASLVCLLTSISLSWVRLFTIFLVLPLPEAKPSVLKLGLEFDETAQMARLKRGVIEVDGAVPVLV